jgi:hypothetical protein
LGRVISPADCTPETVRAAVVRSMVSGCSSAWPMPAEAVERLLTVDDAAELHCEIHGIDLEAGMQPPEQTIEYRRDNVLAVTRWRQSRSSRQAEFDGDIESVTDSKWLDQPEDLCLGRGQLP